MANGTSGATRQPTVVPKIENETVKQAKVLLGDIPLKIGSETRNAEPSDDQEKVKSQNPAEGSDVPPRPLPPGYFVGAILYGSPDRDY